MPGNSPRRQPGIKNVTKPVQPVFGGRKTEMIVPTELSYARQSAGWIITSNPNSPGLRRGLERHALSSPEREVCGFVYHDRYVRLTNVAENPNSFSADPSEVAHCLARYGEPQVIFHSHPNGTPNASGQDLQLASYYINSTIIIGVIINGRLELSQVVAPPQLDPAPAVQP